MKNPTFVKTYTHLWDCGDAACLATHSASYTDFWKLVELAGFPIVQFDQIEWHSDKAYIISPLTGEVPSELPERKCKLIHWNLERWSEGLVCDGRFDETWVSDLWFSTKIGARYVTLGTDKNLRLSALEVPKKYDFIHLSYLTDRRKRFIDYVSQNGLTVAPNGWGEERDLLLRQSRTMLALHQDEVPMIEPLRYALAVAYNLPILAEESSDFCPFKKGMEAVNNEGMPKIYELIYPITNYDFKQNVLMAMEERK